MPLFSVTRRGPLIQTKYLKGFFFSLAINLFHPNYFCEYMKNNKIKFYNSMIDDTIFYSVNDLLTLPSFLRIFLILNYMIKSLRFNSNKSDRVW